MPKILTITSKAFPGINSVFNHGRSLGFWDQTFLEYKLPNLSEYDGVILAGTIVQGLDIQKTFSEIILMCNAANIPVALLGTSSIGQMEFTQGIENKLLRGWTEQLEKKELDYLFFGSKELSEAVNLPKSRHFPYPFNGESIKKFRQDIKATDSIGIFSPFNPRKNIQNQTAAIALAKRKRDTVHGYTNLRDFVTLDSDHFDNFSWLPNAEEYWGIVSKMKIFLHVTHVESFCYAVVEAITLGTIPIVSQVIADNLNLPDDVIVKNPDSPTQISNKILEILELDDSSYNQLLAECQQRLNTLTTEQNTALRQLLQECFLKQ